MAEAASNCGTASDQYREFGDQGFDTEALGIIAERTAVLDYHLAQWSLVAPEASLSVCAWSREARDDLDRLIRHGLCDDCSSL